MTVLTVRNLDEVTRDRLKAQAAAHGRSMEGEARAILSAAVSPPVDAGRGLGTRIAALFAGESFPETVRGHQPARVAEFDA